MRETCLLFCLKKSRLSTRQKGTSSSSAAPYHAHLCIFARGVGLFSVVHNVFNGTQVANQKVIDNESCQVHQPQPHLSRLLASEQATCFGSLPWRPLRTQTGMGWAVRVQSPTPFSFLFPFFAFFFGVSLGVGGSTE